MISREVSWAALKSVLVSKGLGAQGTEDSERYLIMAIDGPLVFETVLLKSNQNADLADFETNFKPTWNTRLLPTVNGFPITRPATTKAGWHYGPRYITWTTSKAGSLHNRKIDATTDWADATVQFWKSDWTELKRADYLSDLLFQTALDTLCTYTTMDWLATYDFDIRGAIFLNGVRPASPTYGYVIAAPDIAAASGGSIPFLDGGFPLHLVDSFSFTGFDALTVKSITADPVLKSNKFRLLIEHAVGLKLEVSMGFQHYRA